MSVVESCVDFISVSITKCLSAIRKASVIMRCKAFVLR